MDDRELLERYRRGGEEEAFAELVRRHGVWIYPSARRQLGDDHLAEDAAQGVFLLLASKAGRLSPKSNLGAWLWGTLRYCISEVRRQRSRQRHYEKEAAKMRSEILPAAGWEEIWPLLDDAVGKLGKADQEVVLLRFYQQKAMAEVGEALGVSEEAAKKRVQRAVGKLREKLSGKGVEVETGSLGAMVLAHAVEGMEGRAAGLVEKVMAGIGDGAGNGTAGLIAQGAEKMMLWAKVKVAAACALASLALIIPMVYLVAAERPPEIAAVPGPTTHEVVEVLDGAPSLEELVASIEKHDMPPQNLHIAGFERVVYRRPSLDVEWKKTPVSSRGDAWFSGGPDGKARIRLVSWVAPWEGGSADYAEMSEDLAFDGQTFYWVRHMGGPAGKMRPERLVMLSGKRGPILDGFSTFDAGALFTLQYGPGRMAKRQSAFIRELVAAGGKLQVARVRVDGVEMIRVTSADGKASSLSADYDPQHGYAIRKLESWWIDNDGHLGSYDRKTISSLVEAGPGVWFPTAAELVEFEQPTRKWVRHEWTAQRVEANQKDFDEQVFVPEYPATYRVDDTRTDEGYRASRQGDEFEEGKSGGIEPDKLARAKEMYRVGIVCRIWATEHKGRWPGRLEELKGFTLHVRPDETKGWEQWVYCPPGESRNQKKAVLFEKTPAFADGELVVFADGFVEFVKDRQRITRLRAGSE